MRCGLTCLTIHLYNVRARGESRCRSGHNDEATKCDEQVSRPNCRQTRQSGNICLSLSLRLGRSISPPCYYCLRHCSPACFSAGHCVWQSVERSQNRIFKLEHAGPSHTYAKNSLRPAALFCRGRRQRWLAAKSFFLGVITSFCLPLFLDWDWLVGAFLWQRCKRHVSAIWNHRTT